MSNDLMLDIETLGTTPDAVILTIGAQSFDPLTSSFGDVNFYKRINTETQENRKIDDPTVEWWAKQSSEAQEEAFGDEDRVELSDALDELGKLIWKSKRIWANGISFDMSILEHAYKSLNILPPWQYYNVLDARTIYKLNPDNERLGNSHHALEDCILQIDLLQRTLKKLGITKLN